MAISLQLKFRIGNTALLSMLLFGQVAAQSTVGLTQIPDTSFNIQREYEKLHKTFPEIRIASVPQNVRVKEKKNLPYSNTGKRSLLLDAFCPKDRMNKKRVAVVILHGGGWRSGNRTHHYPLAQALALRGYVCFTPEYRLSTEALYPAAVHDVKAAIKWVKRNGAKYDIDTNKVVVLGFSAGGQLAALVGATNGLPQFEAERNSSSISSKVHAIVDIDGTLSFIHPESGEGDDSKRTSAATYWFGYPKIENPALWKQASPLTHAGASTPPTLFINSSVERMHAGRTDFIQLLRNNHIYTEVKEFENSPHSFCLFEPWFTPTVETIDAFLKKLFLNK